MEGLLDDTLTNVMAESFMDFSSFSDPVPKTTFCILFGTPRK